MAETRLTNVVIPTIFDPYTFERSIYLSNFFRSGIAVVDPVMVDLLNRGGRTFNVPFWQETSPADSIPVEGSDITINPITASTEVSVRQWREIAWGSNDMSAVLAGSDPMNAVANYVATTWARRFQANIIAILQGVMADNIANDSSDMLKTIYTEDGDNATDDNKFSANTFIDLRNLHGDQAGKWDTLAVHSVVFAQMQKLNLVDFEPTNSQNIGFGTYLGVTIVVDDQLPETAGTTSGNWYSSFLFERGALRFGQTDVGYTPTETDREPKDGGGIDQLFTRRVFAFHPRGFAYLSPGIAGEFPINTELDDAASWNRVAADVKNTGFVELRTN